MQRKNKKKNKNKTYNYEPHYNPDYSYYYAQQYPHDSNNFDNYNYYTTGRFANNYRHNNQKDYQNGQYVNQDYGYGTYNNANNINRVYNPYTNKQYSRINNKNSITYQIQENKQAEYPNEKKRQKDYTKKEFKKKAELSQVQNTNEKLSYANPELGLLTNISSENSSDSVCSTFITEASAGAPKTEIDLGRPSTRTILKKNLVEYTEVLEKYKKPKTSTPSYTDDYWIKEKEGDSDSFVKIEETSDVYQLETKKKKKRQTKKKPAKSEPFKRANRFEQQVYKMLSAPVEISKGRSMLEKMGWKGGGLGKDGDGIVEPITPKVIYATTTMGLGQLTKEEDKTPIFIDREYFNTLTNILDFVKNYLERELRFEARFSRLERKRIHNTVENIRNGTDGVLPYPYSEIVKEIHHHNDYVLVTESDGSKHKRQLSLYKEAHDHMFLISPEDFDEQEEITDVEKIEPKNNTNSSNENVTDSALAQIEENKEYRQEDKANDIKENEDINKDITCKEVVEENDQKDSDDIAVIKQENDALVKDDTENKSINNIENTEDKKELKSYENIKEKSNANVKEKKEKPKEIEDILDMIIDYLFDFCEDPLYTEFRFLGPFDYIERCAIDKFFDVCSKKCEIERSKEVLDLFNCDDFYLELRLDNNQRYVVHKIEKTPQQTEKVHDIEK